MPEDRAIIVETAEGDELAISHLTGFDEISRCFAFTVGLVGTAIDVTAKAMLGKPLPSRRRRRRPSAGSTAW